MFNREEMNVPVMTLDLRIEPLVKSVVAKMLLSEADVQDAIEHAVKAAVNNFDWRGQIQREVEETIKREVTSQASSMIRTIFWDEQFIGHFRTAIAKALSPEGK